MEELKLLIEMVSNLPTLAVWVLVGFLLYKVAVIGSIYGVIRLAIEKLHDYFTKRARRDLEVGLILDGLQFDESSTRTALITQLSRLKFIGKPGDYASSTIHAQYGVRLLRDAIDRMEAEAVKK